MPKSSGLIDIIEGVLYGRFVGEDVLFNECFTLECEDEFVSLQVVFAAEEEVVVRVLCDARAVRAVWGSCFVDTT